MNTNPLTKIANRPAGRPAGCPGLHGAPCKAETAHWHPPGHAEMEDQGLARMGRECAGWLVGIAFFLIWAFQRCA